MITEFDHHDTSVRIVGRDVVSFNICIYDIKGIGPMTVIMELSIDSDDEEMCPAHDFRHILEPPKFVLRKTTIVTYMWKGGPLIEHHKWYYKVTPEMPRLRTKNIDQTYYYVPGCTIDVSDNRVAKQRMISDAVHVNDMIKIDIRQYSPNRREYCTNYRTVSIISCPLSREMFHEHQLLIPIHYLPLYRLFTEGARVEPKNIDPVHGLSMPCGYFEDHVTPMKLNRMAYCDVDFVFSA
jgi:hypothetical protein